MQQIEELKKQDRNAKHQVRQQLKQNEILAKKMQHQDILVKMQRLCLVALVFYICFVFASLNNVGKVSSVFQQQNPDVSRLQAQLKDLNSTSTDLSK